MKKRIACGVYRLAHPKEQYMKIYGIDTAVDFQGPLVL